MIRIRLSTLLGERRMTQKKLSQLTGIRANAINDMYHELSPRVNLEYIDRICSVLEVNMADILVRDSDYKKSPED